LPNFKDVALVTACARRLSGVEIASFRETRDRLRIAVAAARE
jgi:hypothetical protein